MTGQELRELRLQAGVSASRVARLMGVTRQRVAAIERNGGSEETVSRYLGAVRAASRSTGGVVRVVLGPPPVTVGSAEWVELRVAGAPYGAAVRAARRWLRRHRPRAVALAVADYEATDAVIRTLTEAGVEVIPVKIGRDGVARPIRR
jgi:transcriptional regulator with XRE-family HTH domain